MICALLVAVTLIAAWLPQSDELTIKRLILRDNAGRIRAMLTTTDTQVLFTMTDPRETQHVLIGVDSAIDSGATLHLLGPNAKALHLRNSASDGSSVDVENGKSRVFISGRSGIPSVDIIQDGKSVATLRPPK